LTNTITLQPYMRHFHIETGSRMACKGLMRGEVEEAKEAKERQLYSTWW